jgi:hypothetical protein
MGRRLKVIAAAAALLNAHFLAAAPALKKVAILQFVNVDKNPNVQYLEASMTEALETKLGERFTFEKADEKQLKRFANERYLYRDDYATKSVAINLGLAAAQDVVIAGGFTVRKAGQGEELVTTVRIFDVPNKKVVAEVRETSPLDNTIFESIETLSVKIADSAKAVLPTKEEFRLGGGKKSSGPFFANWSFALGAGGALYALEYADRIQANQPAIRAALRANVPGIARRLTLTMQGLYATESPIEGKNPAIEGLKIVTTTIMPGIYFGHEWDTGNFQFHPRFGGGYALQSIQVTGIRNENLSNMMPFAGVGLDVGYTLTSTLDLVLSLDSLVQLQGGKSTLLNTGSLGLLFRF